MCSYFPLCSAIQVGLFKSHRIHVQLLMTYNAEVYIGRQLSTRVVLHKLEHFDDIVVLG